MSWDEDAGQVTRAFDEWRMTDHDIRAFLRFSLRIAGDAYEGALDSIDDNVAAAGNDYYSLPDLYEDETDGLWPHDFEWMLLSGALKDAVTAFDVYLEKAMEEVLSRHGFTARSYTDEKSLSWDEATDFYKRVLGIYLKGDQALANVRDLRHILTHKRGDLRTDTDRKRFGIDEEGWTGSNVELTHASTLSHMNVLGDHVRRVDPAAYSASWGGQRPQGLDAYVNKKYRPTT